MERVLQEKDKEIYKLREDLQNPMKKVQREVEKEYRDKLEYLLSIVIIRDK